MTSKNPTSKPLTLRFLSFLFSSILFFSLVVVDSSWARGRHPPQPTQEGTPPCIDKTQGGIALPVMNEVVLGWKQSTPNQTLKRAHVAGVLVRVVEARKSHAHFEVKIGEHAGESLELIYNVEFGRLPALSPGAQVEACGDYITSTARAGRYPPSPMGAILHWIHFNPGDRDGGRHEHGYVMIDGVVYGGARGETAPGLFSVSF